jgi:hypothetical protein
MMTDPNDDWHAICVICGEEGPYRCVPGLGTTCSGCRMQAMREDGEEEDNHDPNNT